MKCGFRAWRNKQELQVAGKGVLRIYDYPGHQQNVLRNRRTPTSATPVVHEPNDARMMRLGCGLLTGVSGATCMPVPR